MNIEPLNKPGVPLPPPPPPETTGLNIAPPVIGQAQPPLTADLPFLKPRKTTNVKMVIIWSGVGLVAILLAVSLFLLLGHKKTPPASSNTAQNSNSSNITPGTDNSSLDQDLKTLTSNTAQGDQDQTTVDSGVNDNKSQVDVPTN
jgi:phosphoglycerol transferase MdoB-like AlkP superfamily enzyme